MNQVSEKLLKQYEREEARKIQAKEEEDFKTCLLRKHGVSDNPKANQAYALAWEYGHAHGYQEVEVYFSDIVQLIKD